MKKFVTASLFVFIAVIAGVAIVSFISGGKNNQSVAGSNSGATSLILSSTELAKHKSVQSCWLLISGKIYDVTSYLNKHPGGEAEILKTCGTDATVIYGNRDNTGTHSSRAKAMLTDYYIGDLNQTVATNPANPTTPAIANPNPALPPSGGEFEDD